MSLCVCVCTCVCVNLSVQICVGTIWLYTKNHVRTPGNVHWTHNAVETHYPVQGKAHTLTALYPDLENGPGHSVKQK